jgi:hypothetical protein
MHAFLIVLTTIAGFITLFYLLLQGGSRRMRKAATAFF